MNLFAFLFSSSVSCLNLFCLALAGSYLYKKTLNISIVCLSAMSSVALVFFLAFLGAGLFSEQLLTLVFGFLLPFIVIGFMYCRSKDGLSQLTNFFLSDKERLT